MMMKGHCRCPHHVFAKAASLLGGLSALLFFVALFSGSPVWGWDADAYFKVVIVLALAAHGTKFCGCCGHHGMGMLGMKEGMPMEKKLGAGYCDHEKGICKHPEGCTCGQCSACTP